MKRAFCLLVCAALAFSAAALADREVQLPNSRYAIDVPDWMRYSPPGEGDSGVHSWYSEMLEINYTAYRKADAVSQGMPETLREAAEQRSAAGADAELRSVNGIEMLVFRTTDEEDGAPCIGYVFEDGDWLVEVDFWYATKEAANQTAKIISTIH